MDIKLSAFEGPLDLLLHLITKNEVDIYDIPIGAITEQFLSAIDGIEHLDMDQASDFIVMAATLLEIKSKLLLPGESEMDVYIYEGNDPREDLVKRLLVYRAFKYSADQLGLRQYTLDAVAFRAQGDMEPYVRALSAEALNEDLEVALLLEATRRVCLRMRRYDEERRSFFDQIVRDHYTVDDKISSIRERLASGAYVAFSELCGQAYRAEIIVTFLAVLELLKIKEISVEQPVIFGDIQICRRNEGDKCE